MQKLIIFLLLMSPALFASARPVWQWMWIIYVFVGVILTVGQLSYKKVSHKQYNILPVPTQISLTLFLCICFYQIITFGPGLDGERAIFFALQVLSILGFHFIIAGIISNRLKAEKLLFYIVNIISLYALWGFIAYITGNDHVLWYEKTTSYGSLTSTFINRNSFAAYLGMGLILAALEISVKFPNLKKENRLYRHIILDGLQFFFSKGWLLGLKLVILLTALLLTTSRAGVFSSLLMLAVFFLLNTRLTFREHKLLYALGAFLAFAAFSIIGSISGEKLEQRLYNYSTLDTRFVAYEMIIDGIKEKPILGHGAGSFEHKFQPLRDHNLPAYFDRAHNDYLELAFTIGIPGTLIFLTGMLALILQFTNTLKHTKKYRKHLLAILCVIGQIGVHSLIDFPLQMPATAYTFTAILTIGLIIVNRTLKRDTLIHSVPLD
ncbi:O-antigen ligase family protein [Kordiimonas laminariae]|uniref:O-antigen ligase family protein n=1 Tax=Kordiimonas laminariae TaxID=2917717 RepID=UPI001FF512F4|nr:O-antigen ligase family protein [Kordiimonas laminariae]